MRITMHRTGGAALALAGLLALGACGSDGSTGDGTDTGSSQSQGDTVDAGDLAGRMVAAMQKAGTGTMSMQTGDQKASGDFKYVDGKLQQHTTVPVEGSEMEIIAVGDFVYLKGLPGQDKPWVRIDPKADDPVSQMFKGIAEGGLSDPTKMAANLKGTKATLKSKDGDNSTYEFSVDPAKALGSSAAPSPSASASAQQLTMTYVLTKDNLPVTISTEVGGQSIKVTYGDWGKKVDISEPPADQVGEMSYPSAS